MGIIAKATSISFYIISAPLFITGGIIMGIGGIIAGIGYASNELIIGTGLYLNRYTRVKNNNVFNNFSSKYIKNIENN